MRLAVKAFDDQREVRFFLVELDPEEALRMMEAVKTGLPGISNITGVTLEAQGAVLVGWHEALEELVESAELGFAVTALETAEAVIYAPTCVMCVTNESVYWLRPTGSSDPRLAWPHDRVTPVDSFTLEREDIEVLLQPIT